MILYLSPGAPSTLSGGTRKLYDHVAILQANGFDAGIVDLGQLRAGSYDDRDIVVIPEVYGDGIRDLIPPGLRRVVFVQNSYLTDEVDGMTIVGDPTRHPYLTTPELVAIFTESQHTEDRLTAKFPNLTVPLIRTHSSGNGRHGQDAGFTYGFWPRERRVVFFDYKHETDNRAVFKRLTRELPDGWSCETLTGRSDEEIAEAMRTVAIFAAANRNEGMCAPTSEAIISGCAIVCWTGGGPDEYLIGRAVIAEQDNVDALRNAIVRTAQDIDENPEGWARRTLEWSMWFQNTYSREGEIDELCAIFDKLHGKGIA